MSLLLLLRNRKIYNSINKIQEHQDYAIWDQQDDTISKHTETIDITINKLIDSSIKTPLHTSIPEASEVQYNDTPNN